MSNILLWKELAARHERLRESSKKEGGKNWSKAQTGLGQEPGERGRAVPTTTAPDPSRERLLSRVHFSTEPVPAAASAEGRWAPCRGAPSLAGSIPTSAFAQHGPGAAPRPRPGAGCDGAQELPQLSSTDPGVFLRSRALAQAHFCLSRYPNPGSGQSSPQLKAQHSPARSSCSLWHFPAAQFLFALNFQPSEAIFLLCILSPSEGTSHLLWPQPSGAAGLLSSSWC